MGIGGTERQVLELSKILKKRGYTVLVYVLEKKISTFTKELKNNNIPIKYINTNFDKKYSQGIYRFVLLKKIFSILRVLLSKYSKSFIETVKKDKPDILYSFGTLPCSLAVIAKKHIKTKIIWGIRSTNIITAYPRLVDWYYLVQSIIYSRLADVIISNSIAGKNIYIRYRFQKEKIVVIPNGIDTNIFKPNIEMRNKFRKMYGIHMNELVIGHAARLDPLKDHQNFLHSVSIFIKSHPCARFCIAGDGKEKYIKELKVLSQQLGVERNLIWLHTFHSMPDFYNAIDFLTLTSISEGFPNVIVEAMSCGKPCITTDVGDGALIVKGTGFSVPKSNPEKLAEGWEKMYRKINSVDTSNICRRKVIKNYSVTILTNRFCEVIDSL